MSYINDVFEDILQLKDNWNGNGAKSFNRNFILNCKNICLLLKKEPKVFPTACDSIQLEYENGKNYLGFEIFEDITTVFKKGTDGKELTFKILDVNEEILNILISEFYNE